MEQKWNTKQQLTDLLCSLVEYPSITGQRAEIAIVEYLQYLLSDRPYFMENPDHLQLHPLKDGRQLFTALVKKSEAADTIILLSHIDVVGVEDYGVFQNLAFHPRELTQELKKHTDELPEDAARDLKDGNWLFGRGTMDMKAGLTVHLSMLEQAMNGAFDGNILLLAVPDEEVNSLGMLTALPVLDELKKVHGLEYKAAMNGEPMFSSYPGDPAYYYYTGSIGKVLPGFLCYGKETHVGEPFAGLNANMMNSYVAGELELNEAFIEVVGDEKTPPPVSLMQRDLKEEYSVQTPQSAVAMYNVLYMKQSIAEINDKLMHAAEKAKKHILDHYYAKAANYLTEDQLSNLSMDIQVMTYDELYQEAVKRVGKGEVERRQNLLEAQREKGDRDFSTLLVQDLAGLCKDLSPMIILFYSPPFYPAVSSNDDPYIQSIVERVREKSEDAYGMKLEKKEYFPGLSDLSFIGPVSSDSPLDDLLKHMPIQGRGFELPENVMKAITMPIINLGPRGKDAHQWTERLELNYSFEFLPEILKDTLQEMFKG
ncbi:M20/M25/M40 family metallo-hydrolase [Thalassobacillus hwangdonensis]|uniref:M20/M25/M40 family metallo-hydrolase n=1 Tax=Thalassobacillus hwangdonensis TaxID=546108 RepID=A0ABW3L1X5_9BACI